MDELKLFFDSNSDEIMKIISSLVVIIISMILYRLFAYLFTKSEEKANGKLFTSNKGKTYINLIKNILRYVFFIIAILIILKIYGVNISSALAGVGIASVIFGLAIQDWLKDIIRGSSILSDHYFQVGDIVKYKEIEGKVLVLGLKTTKIQDLKTSNIISIANRNIEQIEVVSNFVYLRIPMPYEVSLDQAEHATNEIVEMIKKNNNVEDCRYLSVAELGSSAIEYQLEITCNPQYKLQVRRDALRSILLGLSKNNITVPYTQIDIHNK